MSSTCQAPPHTPKNPSGFQKATMPELQITSDDEEADIWLEAERLKRECLEAEQCEKERAEAEQHEREWVEAERWEQEQLGAERWEQECLESKCQEWEAQAQLKTGESKGKVWEKGPSVGSHILPEAGT
ncbi:hypothetical protein F5J12DRAFT_896069 [Pisolithus orientalis]|uniref:uncharacterized protein n=1 Tax=Pisolithus orientalis TaxID=936130 RepID=UPI0022242CC9|nr:uncharacterized protein F5J12DRAFT_896069 [Pisolithus orientalis]KAI5996539.1 hypothetical protein F5J12DRAFT_896069 [Pisolithus orientalis]